MDEVDRYVIAAIRARGYPEDFAPIAARRVRFLEARGLPGFATFIAEMVHYRTETLQQRANPTRPDGSLGRHCPFIQSVRIGEKLEWISTLALGEVAAFTAPSNPLLVVPKLAEFAGPNGVVMMAVFYVGEEVVSRIMVDGHRACTFREVRAKPAFGADRLGIARFPEEEAPGDLPLRAGHVRSIKIPAVLLRKLISLIGSQE